jgi:hypothetical protein
MQTDKLIQANSIDDLCKIKIHYVDNMLKWYGGHITWPRIIFRSAGIIVIVLSLGMPFLSTVKGELGQRLVLIASFMIAVLTALNSFFNWQKTWEKRVMFKLTLEGLVAQWEAEIIAATAASDPKSGFERACNATRELIEKTRATTATETGSFFAGIKFPDVDLKSRSNIS